MSHRVCYGHAPKRFRELPHAQADGRLMKLLKRLTRAALIVSDHPGNRRWTPMNADKTKRVRRLSDG